MRLLLLLSALAAAVYLYAYGLPARDTVRRELDRAADTATRAAGAVRKEVGR